MEKDGLCSGEDEPPGMCIGPAARPGTPPVFGASQTESDTLPLEYSIGLKSEGIRIVWNGTGPGSSRFESNLQTLRFRERFFHETTDTEWEDWHWQLRHRITHLVELERVVRKRQRNSIFSGTASRVMMHPKISRRCDHDGERGARCRFGAGG
jgi:hypothetical protein